MTPRLMLFATGLAVLVGCGSGGPAGLGGSCPKPEAVIDGPTQGFRNDEVYAISAGKVSFMANWTWSLQAPAGSTATLDSNGASSTAFTPDISGTYVVKMQVTDECGTSDVAQLSVAISNRTPVADAGADQSVPHGAAQVTLDGTASSDPDGDALQYAWTLVSRPAASAAALSDASAASPTFVADVPGTYLFSLTVNDGEATSTADTVQVVATNDPPVASAGAAQSVNLPDAVSLAGSATDTNGDAVTYTWGILQEPVASTNATFSDPTSPSSQFTPDVEGSYVLGLTAHDGYSDSTVATVTITAYRHIQTLTHDVVDAAFSAALNEIVTISTTPSNALYLYDPSTGSESSLALSLPPKALSVSPDGLYAAVGHNGYVSYVDLSTMTLVGSPIAVSANVAVLALSATHVYAVSAATDQNIQTIDLSTGTATQSTTTVYASNALRLHPGGTALYTIDADLSPIDMAKFSIDSKGTAQVAYDSQYHGDYDMGSNFWFTQDGSKIITAAGNIFTANPAATSNTSDLVYAGALEGYPVLYSELQWVAHSTAVNETATIPANDWTNPSVQRDIQLKCYTGDYFTATTTTDLPKLAAGGTDYLEHGRYVFYKSDGSEKYVLVQADSGAPSPFGVVTY